MVIFLTYYNLKKEVTQIKPESTVHTSSAHHIIPSWDKKATETGLSILGSQPTVVWLDTLGYGQVPAWSFSHGRGS